MADEAKTPARRLAQRGGVTAVLVMSFVVVACDSGDGGGNAAPTSESPTTVARSLPLGEERTIPEGDEPDVLGPLGETEVEFVTDDGVVQIGAADVPDAVASVFPVPDDVEIQLSSQSGDDAGFSGVTAQTFGELVDFYESELPDAGYQSTQTQFVDGVVVVYEFEGPNGTGNVAISSAPGGGRSLLVTFQG